MTDLLTYPINETTVNMNYQEKQKFYRDEFPILKNLTFLNHASHGLWSKSSIENMNRFASSLCDGPMFPYEVWEKEQNLSRELMEKFLNADPGEIGFNFNTSLSLMMFTHAMHWEKGDNMIVPDRSFPSIVMPAKLMRQWGVEARVVDCVDGLVSVKNLINAIDARTKLMIVPLVDFLTGQRLDIKSLSKACSDAGVFLVVDAIQAAGPIEIDVKELGCNALCFGSPKWMFSPMGIGTVYLNHDDLDRIKLPQMGMFAVTEPWNFFDYDQEFVNDSRRFECGCPANLCHFGINPNVKMFLDLGVKNTENYLLEITGRLHDELTSRGAKVVTPRDDRERAAIVTFDAKSAGWEDANQLMATLEKSNVIVAVRMGLARVSPHFYNDWDEIEKLLGIVFGK
jgi:selenocysteine lyase/cysteine desulfurase